MQKIAPPPADFNVKALFTDGSNYGSEADEALKRALDLSGVLQNQG